MANLVLGPLLRFVDDSCATVWVETDSPATVEVLGSSARTFHVRGHHYALVPVRDLPPETTAEYEVRLDGEVVWPLADAAPSTIRAVPRGRGSRLRLWFGSCHYGRTEDPERAAQLGPDALEACARELADLPAGERPDALLLMGDQVYADETTPQLQRELSTRRDLSRPPGTEVADFEEYTLLYRHAWGEPMVRWLLSAVPTMMIFDDHDVRDDWNTSRQWRSEMALLPWWRERLLGGLISYWIYQHIGNLSPDLLEHDQLYQEVVEAGRSGDAWDVLHEFAARADTESGGRKGMRWSYHRDLGPARLVVLDTRAGRMLDTTERSMLSAHDFEWLEAALDVGRDHLLIASSLPWLLPPSLHHLQSWNEVACTARGRLPALAEKIRQAGDLEHWASFRSSFDRLTEVITRSAGEPAAISVLSGDVHHSYLAEVSLPGDVRSSVTQVTCSPLHNAAPRFFQTPLKLAWWAPLARLFQRLATRAGVAPVPLDWEKTAGPYFGNTVGVLELQGRSSTVLLRQVGGDGYLTTTCRQRLA